MDVAARAGSSRDAPVAAVEPANPSTPQSRRSAWRSSLAVLVGARELDEDQWDPLDRQYVLGIETDFRPPAAPIGFELGVSGSGDWEDDFLGTGIDAEALLAEVYGGARVTLDLADDVVHPYVAAGVTFLYSDVQGELGGLEVSDDDTSFAGYVHGGVYFTIGGDVNLGIDLRGTSGSDVTLFGADRDVDYFQIAAILGTTW